LKARPEHFQADAGGAVDIQFRDADVEGRFLGRRVAAISWNKAQKYISGADTAKQRSISNEGEAIVCPEH
jgi:hypothetical protein